MPTPEAVLLLLLVLAFTGGTTAKTLDVNEDVSKLSEANTHFSINLYKKLIEESDERNVMFSPISVSAAMAMAHLGAKGDSAEQIDKAFMFSKIEEGKFHSAFGELHALMLDKATENITIKSSSRVFASDRLSMLQDYKNALTVYGAQVDSLKFDGRPEAAEASINQWVKDVTEGKISTLLPKGSLSADTALLITNAVYFRGDWHAKFSEKQTEIRSFYVSHYKVVKTPVMFQRGQFKYAYVESISLQLLELPYAGQEYSMVILLPDNFDLKTVEQHLTPENLTQWLSLLSYRTVDVTLPKFKLEDTLQLHEVLPSLGVVDVFDPTKSDLSAIAAGERLSIDQVLHKAVLEVDEAGGSVEAERAEANRSRQRTIVYADHPFIILVKRRSSNAFHLMGAYKRPEGRIQSHDEL